MKSLFAPFALLSSLAFSGASGPIGAGSKRDWDPGSIRSSQTTGAFGNSSPHLYKRTNKRPASKLVRITNGKAEPAGYYKDASGATYTRFSNGMVRLGYYLPGTTAAR